MSQPQRGRGRGRGGSGPPTRGRGSPSPSTGGGGGGGGYRGGRGGRGGGPSVPSYGSSQSEQRGGGRGGGRGGFSGPRGGPPQVFAAGQPLRLHARLDELDQLVRSFERLQVPPDMPLRPGWGTKGTPGNVRVNFFAVALPQNAVWYEYEIAFAPATQAKGDRRGRIMELVEQSHEFAPYVKHVAHDRAQRMVSARKLPQPLEIPIRYLESDQADDPNARTFTVEIKLLGELRTSRLMQYMSGNAQHRDIDTLPIVSALNLVLQSYASKRGVRVGRNKYFFPTLEQRSQMLSLGVEARRGFFMSVRPMYKQLMVNVNVCMTAFYSPGNLARVMQDFQQQTSGGMPSSFADRLKVSTKHLGYTRKFTIFRIMNSKTARKEKFKCDDPEINREVTVMEYFRRKYRINLQYADMPLINVSGNKDKPRYLPPELCEIVPGQAFRGKLDPNQTANMIRFACNPPAFNGDAIVNQGFADLGLRDGTPGAALGAFGLTVSPEMTVVPDRLLPPPGITYRAGRPQVRDGSWNLINVKFQAGGSMANWGVLLVQAGDRGEFRAAGDPDLNGFLLEFANMCDKCGVVNAKTAAPRIATANIPKAHEDNGNRDGAIREIRRALENTFRSPKPSFVLVLLSGFDTNIYHAIKKLADTTLGIHTVHMLLTKARGGRQDQYFANVALKVNSKLGGVNHVLDAGSMSWLKARPTMVMGIDVTHPSPKSLLGTPSIAAVVASTDDTFAQFPASLKLQKPDWNKESKEMVEALTEMTIERLQMYKKKNGGRLPERIVVYRDGVSEGQYDQVTKQELPKLRAAFTQISPGAQYRPNLTVIICGKRHHARFWETNADHMTRNGNTRAGTIVDKGITDIYNFDFYLQAHNGLQGHVRPTHYTVLYDDNKFDADTMQQGTHTASYLYARATKAVSLVPPAYYADIACERGRSYLNVLMNTMGDRSSTLSGARTEDRDAEKERVFQEAKRLWGDGVHRDLKESMFYI